MCCNVEKLGDHTESVSRDSRFRVSCLFWFFPSECFKCPNSVRNVTPPLCAFLRCLPLHDLPGNFIPLMPRRIETCSQMYPTQILKSRRALRHHFKSNCHLCTSRPQPLFLRRQFGSSTSTGKMEVKTRKNIRVLQHGRIFRNTLWQTIIGETLPCCKQSGLQTQIC